jgi:hypothetical protein
MSARDLHVNFPTSCGKIVPAGFSLAQKDLLTDLPVESDQLTVDA